jgi:hypothetical protein
MKSYITSFMNHLYYDLNDVFACNSEESVERIHMANEQSSNVKDQSKGTLKFSKTNQKSKIGSESREVGATSTSMESSTSTLINMIRPNISITIPIFKCLYTLGTKRFWITHQNRPHTDYVNPIEIEDPTTSWEFYTALSRKPFYIRNSTKLQSIYNELGLLHMMKEFDVDTLNNYLIQKTYFGACIKSLFHTPIYYNHMELATIFYNLVIASYVACSFVTLVHTGVVCTVWYKLVPCGPDPMIIPDVIRSISLNQFNHEAPVVEGYRNISYLLTKDIQQELFDLFANDSTFSRVANLNDFNPEMLEDEKSRVCLTGFFTGILICMYITSQFATGVVNG